MRCDGVTEIWVILSVLNVEIRTLSDRPRKSGLMWLRELLHPMDSLERMYSSSIAMYPSKCVCIHASVPQCIRRCPTLFVRVLTIVVSSRRHRR